MNTHARLCLGAVIVASTVWLLEGQSQTVLSREDSYRQNNLGVAHLERYDYRSAITAFRRALTIVPDFTMARLNLAIAQLYDGDLDGAAASAQAAIAAREDSPHAQYVAGLVARAANRPADAARAFQRVLQIDPEDVGSRIQLGQIYSTDRRYAEAAALFEAALAREPFNATAAYGLATALVRSGEKAAGQAAMARFQALRDNPAAITYATSYLEQGPYGEAWSSSGLERDVVDPAIPAVRFEDHTQELFGEADPRGHVTLFDNDNDGDLDALMLSAAASTVLTNEGGRFARRRTVDASLTDGTGGIAGDYDNDGRPDLLVIARTGARLYHQTPAGAYANVPFEGTTTRLATTAAFADLDHDGDLDIFLSPPNRALRNNGNSTFSEITAAAGLAGAQPGIAVIPTDYDNRRDVDLIVVPARGVPALFANQRDGTFRDVAVQSRLGDDAAYTAAATGDINKDGAPDFAFARSGAPTLLALSTGRGTFSVVPGPDATIDATALQLFDYDSDGLLDLLTFGPAGARLWRGGSAAVPDRPDFSDVTSTSLPSSLLVADDPATAMAVGDIDGDGDRDVLAEFRSGRIRFWRNVSAAEGRSPSSVRVHLQARVSNRSAIGAKVELRAGSLRDRVELAAATPAVAPADIVFGLGRRARADVVRVLWPSGILQADPDPPRDVTIVELDRKPSSCPFLFTWNGRQFEFVTDFMGGGEMGAWLGPGIRSVPDPDEYVRLRGDQLVMKDGRYELRITNELEEALFIDRLQLVAVAHPRESDVYPNEGLRSPSHRGAFSLFTTRDPQPPIAAVDHHGHEVLDRLRAIDRRYVDDFRLEGIQGYAEEHSLTLDLGTLPIASPLRLLLTGWTDYAFSSHNVAAHQAGLPSTPPALEIRDADGSWQTILPELGIPVGRPQTIFVDLTPHVRDGGRIEVRVATSMRVYWDQILVDRSSPVPFSLARLDPADARLRWRGFSAEIPGEGIGPMTYDYSRVTTTDRWKTMPGRYTREGDVRPLVTAGDDLFVVSAPGDEIALTFDASRLPPLPADWTRTFMLYSDGFSKEMNLHSSSPDRLEPLPFHAMSRYPYASPEHYPRTPAHDAYRARYNTRTVGGPMPPLLLQQGTLSR